MLENVQIEIKNKEHYEAVKKRLQELGKWCWIAPEDVDSYILTENYKAYIDINTPYIGWTTKEYAENPVTLDDLYEIKKEKVVKERFKIKGQKYSSLKPAFVFNCSTHQEAMDFIKKQEGGTYEIKKYYEVVEE